MKPTKAYILKIDTPISHEYAALAAESCDRIGLPWEYFEGYSGMSIHRVWSETGLNPPNLHVYARKDRVVDNPQCCFAGHAMIWNKIANQNECAVILEHDAMMLHSIDIDIPEDRIVALGYKVREPNRYDHVTAGPPTKCISIDGHEGAHAYAMTPNTARRLIKEIQTRGILGCIDNSYFIKNQRNTEVPLMIMDPTPSIGWIRKSTLWANSADRNEPFIESFRLHYK